MSYQMMKQPHIDNFIPDMHVHSSFSYDSDELMEEYIKMSIIKGYKKIAFTEHLDYDFPGYENLFKFDYDEYNKKISEMRKKFPKINIVKGIEIGLTENSIEITKNYLLNHTFDYVILSVHIIEGKDPYDKKIYNNYSKYVLYEKYLNLILKLIKNFDNYDTLGHFDYITRYAPYSDPNLYYKDYPDIFDNIFKILIDQKKYLEMNSRIFNNRDNSELSFDIDIFKKYQELGGNRFVFGSDSHNIESLYSNFNELKKILSRCEYKNIITYKNKQKKVQI